MIKIAILRTKALRALPCITHTEITLASSTSIGNGSAQLFTPGSWLLHNNRLQNCITQEDTVMRQRCASWPTGTTVRGVAASRFVGRQDLMAYKGLVLTLGSMITIPMVWSM